MDVYITVRNFGKIKEARINISHFTIFVGNNNSGKTQLMELIYAVIKRVSAMTPKIAVPLIDNVDAIHVGSKEIRDLNIYVNNYLKENLHDIVEETFNVPIPIEEISLEFGEADFNYDIYFLTSDTIQYLLEEDIITQEQFLESVQYENEFYRAFWIKHTEGKIKSTEGNSVSRFSSSIPIEMAISLELGHVLGEILGGSMPVASNILFLPASRMGLMLLYKHYFGDGNQGRNALVRSGYQNSGGITKPVVDFLSFLLKYNYTERVARKNKQVVDFIFQNLIDGTINDTGDSTTYLPNGEKKEIPVFVASSMVNEVVPVVKALTDAERIDFIFYDEVETSMHPLKQIEMVKLLNRLNNHGIKLIISTHSDTMATKINNLLLLSYADIDFEQKQKLLKESGISIDKEDLLVSREVHVYQFVNDNHGKSTVEELEFSRAPYTGYDFTLFNDSTMNLFEEAKIAMGIKDED